MSSSGSLSSRGRSRRSPKTAPRPSTGARLLSASRRTWLRINGLITLEDLENYRVVEREPVNRNVQRLRDWQRCPHRAPVVCTSSQMLNILENFPLDEMGYGSADAMHVMAESMKLALRRPAVNIWATPTSSTFRSPL